MTLLSWFCFHFNRTTHITSLASLLVQVAELRSYIVTTMLVARGQPWCHKTDLVESLLMTESV